jgi:hypothetical protein
MPSRIAVVALSFFLSAILAAQSLQEHPAYFTAPSFAPIVSGRTQSIAVNLTAVNEIVIATQFGGLWKTVDGSTPFLSVTWRTRPTAAG